MKPFNLAEAKAGKPVVTRSGYPVDVICYDADHEDGDITAFIRKDGCKVAIHCNNKGIFDVHDSLPCEHEYDLFMALVPKTAYVLTYVDCKGQRKCCEYIHTKAQLDTLAPYHNYQIHEITIEE